jgi:hypothetical protein
MSLDMPLTLLPPAEAEREKPQLRNWDCFWCENPGVFRLARNRSQKCYQIYPRQLRAIGACIATNRQTLRNQAIALKTPAQSILSAMGIFTKRRIDLVVSYEMNPLAFRTVIDRCCLFSPDL